MKISILWLDSTLLVVNKPFGMPTLPDGYHPEAPFLKGVLQESYGRLWTVHRLDKETSGVIAFARSSNAHRNLNIQFEERRAQKVYHALVTNSMDWIEKVVDLPLRPDGDRQHRTVVDRPRGKPSITELRVLERFERYTLLEAIPRTGRMHQIRAHLASIGHPVVVDRLYGDPRACYYSDLIPGPLDRNSSEAPFLARLGLHAWSLKIWHPSCGEGLTLTAPYPGDFVSALNHLRKHPP